MVRSPVNVLAPVPARVNVPSMMVAPVTVRVKFVPVVKVLPAPTFRVPVMGKLTAVVAEAVPLKVRLPVMELVPACRVFTPLPERPRL